MTETSTGRAKWNLFLISLLILFVELACIRWFPAHVLYLTFFTNLVLLAAFLGMSLGCLAAQRSFRFFKLTPLLLLAALAIGVGFELWARSVGQKLIEVGDQRSPELVYFGTEYHAGDLAKFAIPVEAIGAFFFLLITVVFIGLGQELGRALNQISNRIQAYTINIFGSVIGIVFFAVLSWFQLPPLAWFLPAVIGLAWFLFTECPEVSKGLKIASFVGLIATPLLANVHGLFLQLPKATERYQTSWSPYYRIDYLPAPYRDIDVNLLGHQKMVSRDKRYNENPGIAYPLPYLLNRHAGGPPFKNVLIIGAGSGNDVSRALKWGVEHVDAVEIDPVIAQLGTKHHPDKPYSDPRVTLHLDDGRNFLRAAPEKKYDLVVYALVDSLVLHSSYSNIRLESYLFTQQAFQDIKRCLKPNGVFAMYNFFRQGWVVTRIQRGLSEVFEQPPIALSLPYKKSIKPDESMENSRTVFLSGDVDHIRKKFDNDKLYWLESKPATKDTPNGFETTPPAGMEKKWIRFGPMSIEKSSESIRLAEDDWPFLYLRKPTIPAHILRGLLIMGGIALAMILFFIPRGEKQPGRWHLSGRMFFLGAGFMLIETKAVVHMALLFGSTWIVNTVVFFAVLVMILLANLFVLKSNPQKLWPYYLGLFVALLLNVIVPLDAFLGMNRTLQVIGGCLLTFTPILFAGVIFAVSFKRTRFPDLAFGANIAGAMMGGLAESTSMLLGFRYLVLVAMGLYLLSMFTTKSKVAEES